jgi:hypothetical protein
MLGACQQDPRLGEAPSPYGSNATSPGQQVLILPPAPQAAAHHSLAQLR